MCLTSGISLLLYSYWFVSGVKSSGIFPEVLSWKDGC